MADVGPVLEAGEVARVVIEALKRLNENVRVDDRGSYFRVRASKECRLTREAVENLLGRPFTLPSDLEEIMPSFQGRFRVTEYEATWTSGDT